ncbi:MAG: EutN/CcmL family microcompartment protein [Calditrichaceae bacterium]
MIICRVLGDIVSTVKNSHFEGKKLMIVQPLDLSDQAEGKAFIALDTVQAGMGDKVLVMREGGSARIIFNDNEIPVQAVIVGVVDNVDIVES